MATSKLGELVGQLRGFVEKYQFLSGLDEFMRVCPRCNSLTQHTPTCAISTLLAETAGIDVTVALAEAEAVRLNAALGENGPALALVDELRKHEARVEELEAEVTRLQRARIGDSERIGAEMCQREAAEAVLREVGGVARGMGKTGLQNIGDGYFKPPVVSATSGHLGADGKVVNDGRLSDRDLIHLCCRWVLSEPGAWKMLPAVRAELAARGVLK